MRAWQRRKNIPTTGSAERGPRCAQTPAPPSTLPPTPRASYLTQLFHGFTGRNWEWGYELESGVKTIISFQFTF